jgi:arabinogalactan oligomer/maltooligosaccharide transport system permease protein
VTTRAVHRRRFTVGVLLGTLLGVGIGAALLTRSLEQQNYDRAGRTSIVTLGALVEVVERAGGQGDSLRTAVADFAAAHPRIRSSRILSLSGARLEASTAAEDVGEKVAPRRLAQDEKALFDQGQRIRAAVQTNRDEGAARKEEIEIKPSAGGGLELAAPFSIDGAMAGIVHIETLPVPRPPRPSALFALLLIAGATILFLAGAMAIGERRTRLSILSGVLVLLAVGAYGRYAIDRTAGEIRGIESAVVTRITEEGAAAGAALEAAGFRIESPLRPASWDMDVYRRPLGIVADDATVDARRIAASQSHAAGAITKTTVVLGLLSIGLLLFVGLGIAGRGVAGFVRYRQAYAYALPALIGMLLLVFFPFFYGIALSFTGSTIYNTDKPLNEIWTGFKNFIDILGNFNIAKHTAGGLVFDYQNFYWTLMFTIVWTISNVTIGVTVGLFLALILNTKGFALRPIYRVLLIFPWAMPNYITALIWKGMFHQQFGVANQLIQVFGGQPIAWFEKTGTAFATVLATNAWLSFPFMMVISLGALQSIPSDLYEAARVDGAGRWQQFRSVTLPSLKPALVPAIILSVIWTFNQFNVIYLVTAGEPAHSTELLITQAYKFAFEQYRYGYAAAYSTVIFLILLAYGIWQNKVTKATEGI